MTVYSVYMIENMINHKKYIGSTINLKQRWRAHRTAANQLNRECFQKHLYYAINKYGINNFSFSVLKDDFETLEDMWQYEHNKILEFDTINPEKGYNNTDKTGLDLCQENCSEHTNKISQPCAKVNVQENIIEIYSSYNEAARMNNHLEGASKIRKVCKGESLSCFGGMFFRDLDENSKVISLDINLTSYSFKNRKPIYGINLVSGEEKIFESISAASKELNNNLNLRQSIQKCLNGEKRYSIVHNWIFRNIDSDYNIIENNSELTIEDVIERYNYRNPEINGIKKTIVEWCEEYKINPNTYRARIKRGLTPEQALKTPVKGKKGGD